MKEMPLVSVIMSEFNTEDDKLTKSIESILKQTYSNFEFIIIDDSGKNRVKKIIEKFNDPRIRVIENEKNMGLVFSLNRGLNEAKGKYIARMDTDDFAYQDRLKREVEFLEKNTKYTIVGTRADIFDGNKIYNTSNFGEVDRNKILKGSPFIHPTIMMRTKDVLEVGGYPNYKRCEDYALWVNMFIKSYKGYVLEYIGLRYTQSLEDYSKRTLKTRKEFFLFLKEQYVKLKPTKKQIVKMYIKTFIAGILPHKVMFLYHSMNNKI